MASAGSAIPGSADVGDRQAELGCAARLCRPAGQPAVRPQVVEPLRFYACRDRGAQIPARGGPASGCGRSIQDSEFGRRPRKADRDRLQGPSPELHRPPADVTLRLASRTKMCARDAGAEPPRRRKKHRKGTGMMTCGPDADLGRGGRGGRPGLDRRAPELHRPNRAQAHPGRPGQGGDPLNIPSTPPRSTSDRLSRRQPGRHVMAGVANGRRATEIVLGRGAAGAIKSVSDDWDHGRDGACRGVAAG